ncbi:MAG: hypothetical protein M3158_03215, partial [Pseudomonadota bacterium]|nr:hypothetical protein [Pseudomonadota bacterium]
LLFAPSAAGAPQSFVRPMPPQAAAAPFVFSEPAPAGLLRPEEVLGSPTGRPRAGSLVSSERSLLGPEARTPAGGPGSSEHSLAASPGRSPGDAKRRGKVTRSDSCDGKMPEDSWLDICG